MPADTSPSFCPHCGGPGLHTGHLRPALLELPLEVDTRPDRYHREVLDEALGVLRDVWQRDVDRVEAFERCIGLTSTKSAYAGAALRRSYLQMLALPLDNPQFLPLVAQWARCEIGVVMNQQAQRAIWEELKGELDLLGPMATRARRRPSNFSELSPAEKWRIDRELGILDWDGSPNT